MPTVNEKASNGVLDRFPDRIVDVVDFHDCSQGLGLKIFGGYSTTTGAEHGIFVKSVVPGGLAALAGRLQPGDELLEVNGRGLDSLTNARAVNMLRACAAQRILTLVLSRDRQALKGYHKLCSSVISRSMMSLNVSDDVVRAKSRGGEERASPLNTYRKRASRRPDKRESNRYSGVSALSSPHAVQSEGTASPSPKPTAKPRTVHIEYRTGLGMSICGGSNKAEGPGIFIDSVIPGGDVQRQGIMKPGDEIVSVNSHVLEGLTHERAMKILTRLKLRQVKQVEIQYRPGNGVSPRLKLNSRALTAESNGVDKLLSHLAPARSNDRSASPNKHQGSGPKKSASEGNFRSMTDSPGKTMGGIPGGTPGNPGGATIGVSALGGTGGTRSITDTASSFLNTQLDQDSAPMRTGVLAPEQQITMDKLVVALQYLGYSPSQSQLIMLKQKLVIGPNNKVRYADFVAAAREVFAYKLNSEELGTERTLKSLSDSMDDISKSRAELNKSINTLTDYKRRSKLSSSVPDLTTELRNSSAASNLHLHVTNTSRSRATTPRSDSVVSPCYQQSGWSLPQYDKDYSNSEPAELIRECAILAAELRKAEKTIMQYKGITERLMNFASNIQDSFKAEVSRSRSLERGTPLDRSRTRQSLATVVHGASKMITETQELMYQGALPSGWEEAFTDDGARYYINHVTQSTCWDRPIG